MPKATIALIAHPQSPKWASGIRAAVAVERTVSGLELRYELAGSLSVIVWPTSAEPRRADSLWQHTCFEAFVAAGGDNTYYEFNVSPSGAWAAYRFGGYRERLADPELASTPRVELRRLDDGVTADVVLTLEGVPRLKASMPLEVSVTAVIQGRSAALAYFALAHPADQPDFHDRRGFLLTLAPAGGRAP